MNKPLIEMIRKDMKQLLWITGLTATATVALAGALLLLASCSQEENGGAGGSEDRVPLMVAGVSMAADGTNPATRAVPVPVTEGKLGVGVRAGNGYTAQTGLVYTYADGAWTSSSPLVLSKDAASLYAYYPQDGHTPDAAGNVTLATQPYAAVKDLGYALSGGENVCSTHPYAGFVLRHAYSRVGVDILFSKYFGDAAKLDTVAITAGGIYSKGTQNIQTGTFTPGPGVTPKMELTPGETMADMAREYKGYILVVPSPSLTGAKLAITVSGQKWTADLSSALTALEVGKSYRIKAQIDLVGVDLVIKTVEVEEWKTGTSHNGETQFE